MNINEQFELQQQEIAALKAQVNSMREALVLSFNGAWDDDHAMTIDKAVRAALSSTPEQCLNSVKADAIDILGNILEREFGGHTGAFVRLYVDKLRGNNEKG